MKKYDCKIILCGPAVGKTYLADHDDRFVDIDGMRAKYKYGIDEQSNEEFERGKGSRRKTINHDSMEYSIKLLEHTIKNNKIALISYQKELLDYVINNNLDFCLVYADINSRDEYIKRMRDRGNNEAFVNLLTETFLDGDGDLEIASPEELAADRAIQLDAFDQGLTTIHPYSERYINMKAKRHRR